MTNAGSMQATGLMAKDRGGTSDPFAQLFLGGELKFKTKVVPKVKMTQACKLRLPLRTAVHARLSTCKLCALQTVNPTWDETFTLYHKGESLDEDSGSNPALFSLSPPTTFSCGFYLAQGF